MGHYDHLYEAEERKERERREAEFREDFRAIEQAITFELARRPLTAILTEMIINPTNYRDKLRHLPSYLDESEEDQT